MKSLDGSSPRGYITASGSKSFTKKKNELRKRKTERGTEEVRVRDRETELQEWRGREKKGREKKERKKERERRGYRKRHIETE